ncbi:MAG: uracil-DNA glycosylase, partial [Hydrogenobacter sp.]
MDRKLFATVKSLEEIGITELYSVEKREEKKDKRLLLEELYKKMSSEGKCVLYQGSSGYVFGDGNP